MQAIVQSMRTECFMLVLALCSKGAFGQVELPELPYAQDALAPYISEEVGLSLHQNPVTVSAVCGARGGEGRGGVFVFLFPDHGFESVFKVTWQIFPSLCCSTRNALSLRFPADSRGYQQQLIHPSILLGKHGPRTRPVCQGWGSKTSLMESSGSPASPSLHA